MSTVLELPSDLLPVVQAVRRREAELRALGVTALHVYGSRARGDHRPDSDLDVMVEVEPERFSLLDLVAVQHLIGDDVGFDVHATTPGSFHAAHLDRIRPDLKRVF